MEEEAGSEFTAEASSMKPRIGFWSQTRLFEDSCSAMPEK
jgi:hypothetical protein